MESIYYTGSYSTFNPNTLIIRQETFDGLSDKTKKELDQNNICIFSFNNKEISEKGNIVHWFKWMWNVMSDSEQNSKAAQELSKLKHSISTIKTALVGNNE